jgi:hypothetical protein
MGLYRKVTRGIHHQWAGIWMDAIISTFEAVQNFFRPSSIRACNDLKDDTVSVGASAVSRAV